MSIVYVLTNSVMPGLIKIGCTELNDANIRIGQLYTTGVPVPFDIEFAAKVDDPWRVESALHIAFGPYRVNPRREFFRIDPEQAIAILKLLHVEDATAEITNQVTGVDQESRVAAEEQRMRRPRFNFAEMKIPVGAVLRSTEVDISVVVVDEHRVKLGDKEMSLSAATREILGLDYYVRPGVYWTYEGRVLRDIYNETYGE